MKAIRHEVMPPPPPPVTYDLTGLTEVQFEVIVKLLGSVIGPGEAYDAVTMLLDEIATDGLAKYKTKSYAKWNVNKMGYTNLYLERNPGKVPSQV